MADNDPAIDEPAKRPRRMPFRRAQSGPKLSPDAAKRQGQVTTLALTLLGKDAALAFLNGFSQPLGGRPIDLAIASDSGMRRVETEIQSLVAAT